MWGFISGVYYPEGFFYLNKCVNLDNRFDRVLDPATDGKANITQFSIESPSNDCSFCMVFDDETFFLYKRILNWSLTKLTIKFEYDMGRKYRKCFLGKI